MERGFKNYLLERSTKSSPTLIAIKTNIEVITASQNKAGPAMDKFLTVIRSHSIDQS